MFFFLNGTVHPNETSVIIYWKLLFTVMNLHRFISSLEHKVKISFSKAVKYGAIAVLRFVGTSTIWLCVGFVYTHFMGVTTAIYNQTHTHTFSGCPAESLLCEQNWTGQLAVCYIIQRGESARIQIVR